MLLAFGDSLTYGTGAAQGKDYPAQLGALISRKVVAAGMPGETTAQALARLPAALDESDPVHPNAHGYRLIAERIAARLKEAGAI